MRDRCAIERWPLGAAGGLLVLALVVGLAGCKGKEDEPEAYAAVGARTPAAQASAGRTGAAHGVPAAPVGAPSATPAIAKDTRHRCRGGKLLTPWA